MAVIKSGATTDQLTVDPTSKAARVTLYDSSGNEQQSAPTGVYYAPILYTGGTDAAGVFIFAIRNGGTKLLRILRLRLTTGFNGVAAATTQDIEVVSLTGISADSGGTLFTAAKSRPGFATSSVTAVRSAGAITLTGNAVERTFAKFGTQRQVSAAAADGFEPGQFPTTFADIEIAAGTGNALALRLNAAAVAGDSVRGHVVWEER